MEKHWKLLNFKNSRSLLVSELYLWVVCKGVLVRFPYDSTHSKVLGSGREVCPLTFYRVLGFGEGVFCVLQEIII